MLFVLEGCDGSGKTTVAQQLKNVLPGGAEIVHCTTTTTNDFDFFKGLIEAAKYRHIIADRFCYGQFVYQDEENRNLSWKGLEMLETAMLEAGVKVIHVAAPVETIKARLQVRGENTTLPVEEICQRYMDLFEMDSLIKPYVWWTGGCD